MSSDSVKFDLEEIVYLRTDDEAKGMVTGIIYRPNGTMYIVAWGTENEQHHYACELTRDKAFSETKT